MKPHVLLGALCACFTLASAANYPKRLARSVVPFGAGSANGTIGAEFAMNFPKDRDTPLISTGCGIQPQ